MPYLIMDKREDSDRRSAVRKVFAGTTVSILEEMNDICDYIAKDDTNILFGIEWKSYDDFISSMRNGHLQSQLLDMENMEHPYLFIVGNYKSWVSSHSRLKIPDVSRDSIAGFLTSISVRYKTRVIMYESTPEACRAIKHLFEIHTGIRHEQVKLPERRTRTGDPNMDMYLALPGVGPAKAKKYSSMKFSRFIMCCISGDTDSIKSTCGLSVSKSLQEYVNKL